MSIQPSLPSWKIKVDFVAPKLRSCSKMFSEKNKQKKTVNSFRKSTITLLFYLFEKYDTVSPRFSLVLLRSPHILFSLYFVCYYLQWIELKLFKPTPNRFPFFHLTWTRDLHCKFTFILGIRWWLIPLSHWSSWPASIHLLRMHQAHAWSCDSIQDFCRSNIKQIRFIFTGPVKTYHFIDYSKFVCLFVSVKVRTPWKFRILIKEICLIR